MLNALSRTLMEALWLLSFSWHVSLICISYPGLGGFDLTSLTDFFVVDLARLLSPSENSKQGFP